MNIKKARNIHFWISFSAVFVEWMIYKLGITLPDDRLYWFLDATVISCFVMGAGLEAIRQAISWRSNWQIRQARKNAEKRWDYGQLK